MTARAHILDKDRSLSPLGRKGFVARRVIERDPFTIGVPENSILVITKDYCPYVHKDECHENKNRERCSMYDKCGMYHKLRGNNN